MGEGVSNSKILIIDDEPIIRDITSDFLKRFAFTIQTAKNGTEGLAAIEAWQPDAVICDLSMPDMSGLAVLEIVSQKSPDLPFIVFSGNGNINDAINALKKGAWDYLLKPLTNLSLITHTLERAFERRNLLLEKKHYQTRLEDEVKQRTFELSEQIRQQKRTEELLRVSLKEKEVLLSEVHHRVKNNLQIILSLLDLQTDQIANSEARDLIHESQGRIQAMALIHERLFDQEAVTRVDCVEYFRDVGNSLLASLDLYRQVRIQVDMDHYELDATKAFPAGLLFNEILYGILKQAQPVTHDFTVTLTNDPDNTNCLLIQETAGSLKAWLGQPTANSLGQVLLSILVSQAKGSWQYEARLDCLRICFGQD